MSKFESVLIGDESLLIQCAEILLGRGHAISAIISTNASIRQWASGRGVVARDWGDSLPEQLADISYDWLFSAANLRMLPDEAWRKARQGAANFHDGPLPRFAGLNTPSWAIIENAPQYGVTWHALSSGVDEGGIYAQQLFEVSPDETALTLNTKCFEAGISTFADMVGAIEAGTLTATPQDFSQRSYFAKNKRPDLAATLRFEQGADELARLTRALDFGPGYANPLVTPKARAEGGLFSVTKLEATDDASIAAPGTIRAVSDEGVVIATSDRDVLVEGAAFAGGVETKLSAAVSVGDMLPRFDEADAEALGAAVTRSATYEDRARARLGALGDIDLIDVKGWDGARAASFVSRPLPLPASLNAAARSAVILAFLARRSGQDAYDVAYANDEMAALDARFPGYFAPAAPLRVELKAGTSAADFTATTQTALATAAKRGAYLADLPRRFAGLEEPRLTVGLRETADRDAAPVADSALTFIASPDGVALMHDAARISEAAIADLTARLGVFADAFAAGGPVGDLPLMTADEERRVLFDWNQSTVEYDREACIHTLIERQADATPDAAAVAFRGEELTYRQLDARANVIAAALIEAGVGPDVLVGLHVSRGLDLVAGAVGIMKAGGAYVPLDPMFPADRLALMVEDSGAPVILTERALKDVLHVPGAKVMCIEDIVERRASAPRPENRAKPSNLAYVIYTSGSTGRPKGVMLEHGNAVNFFVGMDDRIARDGDAQQVWLAVTSLSFDISVLELFWTLARGFKVVVHSSDVHAHKTAGGPTRKKPLDFGLFYWGNDDGAGPAKYRLLLEGAKFADENGFQSIWTPERHFHAFGGPYPNPAVTGAAVAAVTKNLAIRAGSCVLPLHHPLRVAEEWAVLDNLSNGRVGLAFASGWMPEDFVLRPENAPPHNKTAMLREIETVRKLWRGEAVPFDFGSGVANVVTQPRPVQAELPVWVTTAGNPDTYREAARLGANVLTHLLGQSIEELADKIRIYRETLVETGRNPDDYKVTLMLHTLLGEDREEVREQAREPMKEYLRSAAALIKQYAWAFPAFKKPQGVTQPMEIDLQSLAPDEMDAILEFAFLRYFEDSGLFGTVEDAMARLEQISAIGVDDIACLIDYGVPSEIVLERLKPLAQVVARARAADLPALGAPQPATPAAEESGLAADIRAGGVTHLQCTPSMARMFLENDEDRHALASVKRMFIGGEAVPASLLADLRKATAATVENMYGPTETTIWSSTAPTAEVVEGVAPLGKPIANTQLYVLDDKRRPVAPGMPGELYIGGDGVARGYLHRPDLTDERFLPNPHAGGRYYRTGDLVRYGFDGSLQFLGRADFQVKVRGYRIELGEIEARMSAFEGVAEAVAMAREDRPGDIRIVGYMRTTGGKVCETALREHLRQTLPDYMIPAHFVTLDVFPLTPNAKVDRKALPKPDTQAAPAAQAEYVAPTDEVQKGVAEIFQRVLGVERVGLSDSFFALGGHSLLAVQAHRELKAKVSPELAITDLFRFPTVAGLASHIANKGKPDERLNKVADRAAMRRAALGDRRAALQRAR